MTRGELMRWFTDVAYETDDEAGWHRMLAEYAAHVAAISSRLPPDLARLASDPRLNLHDFQIASMSVKRAARKVRMVVDAGDRKRRLDLRFGGAEVDPENLPHLAMAIETTYRASAWGDRRDVTSIMAMEVDLLPDDRFVLRLRLEPFHAFTIEFERFSLAESTVDPRRRQRAGVFKVKQ